jgi:hypothetical protein
MVEAAMLSAMLEGKANGHRVLTLPAGLEMLPMVDQAAVKLEVAVAVVAPTKQLVVVVVPELHSQ